MMPDAIPTQARLMFRDPADGFTDELLAFSRDEGTDQDCWDAWREMAGEQLAHPDFRHYEYWLIIDGERFAPPAAAER